MNFTITKSNELSFNGKVGHLEVDTLEELLMWIRNNEEYNKGVIITEKNKK